MERQFSSSCPNNCDSNFECRVCFQQPVKPVATPCGHLFCWPCLYEWLMYHSSDNECPFCKSPVGFQNLIPIHNRDHTPDFKSEPTDDNKIPSRSSMHNIEKEWYPTNLIEKTVQANLYVYMAMFLLADWFVLLVYFSKQHLTQGDGEFKFGWIDVFMLFALALAFCFRKCFWIMNVVVYNCLTEDVYEV